MKPEYASICGYQQLKKLRTALAISRGTKLLSTLQQEAESTVSHDQTKRVSYLISLFSRIHRDIFCDWKDQASFDEHNYRPGEMLDVDKRRQFRNIISRLVLDEDYKDTLDDDYKDIAVFDHNGFVIYTDDIAQRLALFYAEMRKVRPFEYGNRLTLDFFMVALSRMPAFHSVYEQGIDFRRLDKLDCEALHNIHSDDSAIIKALEHALDPTRNRILNNYRDGFGRWPESKQVIREIPYLSYRKNNELFLVTINGGLVPLSIMENRLIEASGKVLADFPMCHRKDIVDYLPHTEHLRSENKTEIDGTILSDDGQVPLFCLDINILTGLTTQSHTQFIDILKQCAGKDISVFALADNLLLKEKLLQIAKGNDRLERLIEIAYQRISKINAKLEHAKQQIFTGKITVSQPKMFMAMGGAGAGKTAVEEIAYANCGDNFVIASLDEFRKLSDLYTVMTAANHHSDDYVFVEPFANRLRDLVAKHARENNIHLLYDGTGIPYKPRYFEIVKQFKLAGFHTEVIAVDAFIIKPSNRHQELSRNEVTQTVKQRFELTGRALPWVVTVYKHLRAPRSFLFALEEDPYLDKISLFANDGDKDCHYLVAESFDFTQDDICLLQQQQLSESLANYLHQLIHQRTDSALRILANQNPQQIEQLIARNVKFNEANVAFQIYNRPSGYRGLIIYNTSRMVDFLEKRQLNPNASSEEGLLHKPESLAFHIDPQAKQPWMTQLQSS